MKKPLSTSIAALLLIIHHAHGQDATWLSGGASPFEWTEADNWIPATVPTGTATFTNNGAGTSVTASGPVTIGGITFTAVPNAPSYTIEFDDFFTVNGAGVFNNSTNTQTINLVGNGTSFQNSASASGGTTAVTYNNSFTFNFFNTSTAGNAIIINNSSLAFNDSSSAGTAQITNNATLDFFNSSTAGGATITNSVGEVLTFHDTSTAGTSGITNNGTLYFNDSSTADNATVTNNASGVLDISGLTSGGISIGKITGAGNISLGANNLTVGGLAGASSISGVISDGGAGGSLTKIGGGLLTLSGVNTYTGATNVQNGTLQTGVNGALPTTTDLILGTPSSAVAGQVDLNGTSQQVNSIGLAAGNTGGTNNNITSIAGGPTFTVSSTTTDSTFGGSITGTLSLVKDGAGTTLTLTGANSYIGTTTISGGTLLANNTSGSATGANTLTVNSGGTLGGSGTVGGPIILNSGGTIAPGAGTPGIAGTVLHGTAAGTSLTWNPGGALNLQLGATGDQLALTGLLHGTGAGLDINITNSGISQPLYALATFGSTDTIASDFTLTLPTGYTATLTETATELDLLFTSAAISGPIIENAAPINTPIFADFTVNGAVYTAGGNNTIQSLIFTPGGSLLVNNTLFVTQGPVILVNGSSITLNGNLSVSQLLMLFGSLLNGNGGILGDLINGGVVSPGNSPGIIRVSGNYTQTSTGLLQIQVGGKDISQHDLLAVNGKATLDGTLQLVRLNNFKLQRNDSITFLTANGGVTGRFSMVENDFPRTTILELTVVYSSNSVALEAQQGSFKEFAASENLTPNQRAVGGMLDSAVNDRRANNLINYMDGRILSKLPGDLEKISPDALTSISTIGVALATVQSQNLQRRTDDIRSGSSGFNAANLAINGDGPSFSGRFSMASGLAGPNGNDGKDMTANKVVQPLSPAENRWGAFLSGTGDWVSVGDTNNARGYNLISGGFTLGVDYKVCPNFAVGLMAGYTGTTSDLPSNGRIYVNGGKVGVYATTFVGGWYADVAAFGGYDSYDTRRSALQGDARGSTEGGNIDALIGTGYDFKAGGFTFGPTATFNYTYVGTSAFNEYGSLAPLDIHGGRGESLRSAFGIKASYDWKVGGIVIKPEVRAAWQHEYGDTAYGLDASLASGAGSTFTVAGPQLGRDSALIGAGFAIQCSERCSTYFYYDGELGRKNYESNAVTGGIRLAF